MTGDPGRTRPWHSGGVDLPHAYQIGTVLCLTALLVLLIRDYRRRR